MIDQLIALEAENRLLREELDNAEYARQRGRQGARLRDAAMTHAEAVRMIVEMLNECPLGTWRPTEVARSILARLASLPDPILLVRASEQ